MGQPSAKQWRDLREQFAKLADEEKSEELAPGYDPLRAHVDDGQGVREWILSGRNRVRRARFEALAIQSARLLGEPPESLKPLDVWLESLFLDLLQQRTEGAKITSLLCALKPGDGGIIQPVCEESATFCARLETKAYARSGIANNTPPRDHWEGDGTMTLANLTSQLLPVTSDQAWDLICDDFTLRSNLIAPELNEEFQPEINSIYSGKPRSDAYYANERAKLELRHTNRRAERSFEICCEAWDVQGRPRCRAFFLAILHFCLTPLFDTREACFSHEIRSRHSKLGTALPLHLRDFKRRMDKLRSKWATKIEIASRDNLHQERLKGENELQQFASIQKVLAAALSQAQTRNKPRTNRAGRTLSRSDLRREQVIFGAIQIGLKGPKYCAQLDSKSLQLPPDWIDDGCPSTYALAYRSKKWQKRINDEKCRFGKRYRSTSLNEREAIIQGTSGTRRTRQ